MSRDAVGEEVDHQDPAGDEQHASLGVDVVALCAVDLAGHGPGQVGHPLHSQLLREILLRRQEKSLLKLQLRFIEQKLNRETGL